MIDHRFTDSTDSCDASQARFHRLWISPICGIVLTPKAIRICGRFSVVNFRMTRDLDLKKSCPLLEPDRYFSCSKLDDAKYTVFLVLEKRLIDTAPS